MTRKQALMDLRDKVAAEEWTTDVFWTADAHLGYSEAAYCREAFNGSLDAALALHNAVLPGLYASISVFSDGNHFGQIFKPFEDEWEQLSLSQSTSPARAWLLAILSALIAECGE